jgi:hypothetical protein
VRLEQRDHFFRGRMKRQGRHQLSPLRSLPPSTRHM